MLLCYNRRNLSSLQRVREHWLEECKTGGNEDTPVLLVGLDDEKLSNGVLAERGYYDPLNYDAGGALELAPGEVELLHQIMREAEGLMAITRKTGRRSGRTIELMCVNLWDQSTVQTTARYLF